VRVTPVGRADLARTLAESDPGREQQVVELLGFWRTPPPPPPALTEPMLMQREGSSEPPVNNVGPLIPTPFWRADTYVRRTAEGEAVAPPIVRPTWRSAPVSPPVLRSLSPWPELLPRLWAAIGIETPIAEIDADEVVDTFARGISSTACRTSSGAVWPLICR